MIHIIRLDFFRAEVILYLLAAELMKLAETAVESKAKYDNDQEYKQSSQVNSTVHVLITSAIQVSVVRKYEVVDT